MIFERSKRSRLRFVMKFPIKMPVFSKKPTEPPSTCCSSQARRNCRGELADFRRSAGEQRHRQTDWRRNYEPMRDFCISTRCDGGFHWEPFDLWIDATDGNSIMSA